MTDNDFISKIWQEGKRLYRDLPWRRVHDPYAILVSEVMLQQTQVARVEKYWQRFLQLFPTLDALAAADTSVVLEMWQGLGYNRRALALKRTAEMCSEQYQGQLPGDYDQLLALPGIGKATAGGITAFAYEKPTLYLETNVRTVFLHEYFPGIDGVTDKELEPLVERTCSQDNPRGWYYALLDYGAYLKAHTVNLSRRSKHHSVQSKFEGSRRQKRAEVVRLVLAQRNVSFADIYEMLCAFEESHGRENPDTALVQSIIDDLVLEGFFARTDQMPEDHTLADQGHSDELPEDQAHEGQGHSDELPENQRCADQVLGNVPQITNAKTRDAQPDCKTSPGYDPELVRYCVL